MSSPPRPAAKPGRFRDTNVPPPLVFHVRDKEPYPTATRRIQFHLDHPLYEELDEVLPRPEPRAPRPEEAAL